MCKNLRPTRRKSAIVFKIVAKKPKDIRYYSIAMGFKYPKKAGKIPEVKVQNRLGHYFDMDILDEESSGYEKRMIGRTAGFVKKDAAEYRAGKIARDTYGCEVIAIKAKLTDGLLLGDYGHDPVIAGKHIEFLD